MASEPDVPRGPGIPRQWFAGRWAVAAQVAVAALLFMAITQLTQVIVTRSLALLGMRTDVPTIVAVEACGRTIATSPAELVRNGGDQMRAEPCKGQRPET